MTVLALAILLLAAGGVPGAESEPVSAGALARRFGDAVVLVEAVRLEAGEERRVSGSGFVVEPEGVIATALHVIDGATRLTVRTSRGAHDYVTIRAFDLDKDLALLALEVEGLPGIPLGDPETVEPGERIVVMSHAFGLTRTMTESLAGDWRPPGPAAGALGSAHADGVWLPAARLMSLGTGLTPGTSGAPVFDERGALVALALEGSAYGAPQLGLAVAADELESLLELDEGLDPAGLQETLDAIRRARALPWLEEARFALERGLEREALRAYELALRLHPRFEEAQLELAALLMDGGLFGEAEALLDRATLEHPHSAEAWYHMGMLQARTGGDDPRRGARAVAALNRALELQPLHAKAAYFLGRLLLLDGLEPEARELFERAAQADGRFVEPRLSLGELYLQQRELDEARDAFEDVLLIEPEHATAHLGLLEIYSFRREWQSADYHRLTCRRLAGRDPALRERLEALEAYLEQTIVGLRKRADY